MIANTLCFFLFLHLANSCEAMKSVQWQRSKRVIKLNNKQAKAGFVDRYIPSTDIYPLWNGTEEVGNILYFA